MRRFRPRWVWVSFLLLGFCVVSLELFARFGLGLGTPPLSVTHPTIEYMFAPDQDVHRFHNHIKTNSAGMRSDDVPAVKGDPSEFRVLVLGDSVVNGGSLTDHEQLATTILQKRLREEMQRPVWVGNASAGSWGPQNLLAWVDAYGFYDADVVVLEVAAHDIADFPEFSSLSPLTHPQEQPFSATAEGFQRYFMRRVRRYFQGTPAAGEVNVERHHGEAAVEALKGEQAFLAFNELLRRVGASGARAIVLYHPERDERPDGENAPARHAFEAAAAEHGAGFLMTVPFAAEVSSTERREFRDPIHLSVEGQLEVAEVLQRAILPVTQPGGAAVGAGK